MNLKKVILTALIILIAGLTFYLFKPLSSIPQPASFDCLSIERGTFISADSLPAPTVIYGMGLTYSQHLIETAASFDPDVMPPIFKKKQQSLCGDQDKVVYPSQEALFAASAELESEVQAVLEDKIETLSALLDYEVELGFVLLDSIAHEDLQDESYVPRLGFFIANDLSARSIGLLGEGTDLRYEYWGVSKSFPGFLPMSDSIWIPEQFSQNSIPCIRLETYVNGDRRQSQTTNNMIYTPLEMLRFIHEKYPAAPLSRGDMVLTGTPGPTALCLRSRAGTESDPPPPRQPPGDLAPQKDLQPDPNGPEQGPQ